MAAKNAAFASLAILSFIAVGQDLWAGGPSATKVASKLPQLVIDAQGLSGDPVVSVDISSDGRYVAAASGKEVRVWTLADRKLYATLRGYREPGGYHGGTINVVKFIPGTNQLAVAVSDNTPQGSTRIYDLTKPDRIHQLVPGHKGCTRCLAVSPTGSYFASRGCDGDFYVYRSAGQDDNSWKIDYTAPWGIWGLAPKKLQVTEIDGKHESQLNKLPFFGFSGYENWFLASRGSSFLLLDPSSRKSSTAFSDWPEPIHDSIHLLHRMKLPAGATADADKPSTQDLRIGGGAWYAIAGTIKAKRNRPAQYWAAAYAKDDIAQPVVYRGHRFNPSAIALARGQRETVASGDKLGEVHCWSGRTGLREARFTPKARQLYGVTWSNHTEAISFSAKPHSPDRYHYNRFGPITHRVHLHKRRISLTNADDGDSSRGPVVPLLATNDDDEVVAKNGYLAYRLTGATVNLNPNGYRRQLEGLLPAPRWIDTRHFGAVYCYAESPDSGKDNSVRVIVGSDTGALEEYDIIQPTAEAPPVMSLRRRFIGHSARVTGIAFNPAGDAMVSCAWDGTIRFWSLKKSKPNGDVDFFADGTSVSHVPPESYAARAGIQRNDVILRFDGKPFFERLQAMARGEYRAGQKVEIEFQRKNNGPAREVSREEFKIIIEKTRREGDRPDRRSTTIKLAEAPSYVEPYLTLFLGNDDEWVAYTPKGYYDASPDGEKYVGWHVNRERHETALFYGVEQFRDSLYRPDIIDAVLETHDEAAAIQQADNTFVGPVAPYPEVAAAPRVEFTSPSSPYYAKNENVELTFTVDTPASDPARSIDVRVGGRPAIESPRLVSETTRNGRIEGVYRLSVTVAPGNSLVSARAVGRDTTSAPAKIEVRRKESPAPETAPRLFVLAIGISDYKDKDLSLDWAAADARDFAAAWKNQEGRFYSSVESRVLTDQDASVEQMRDAMEWLANTAGQRPYDVAMIYLAGHGVFNDRGRWYFGGRELNLARLRTTAIPQSELVDLIDRDLACRSLLFADTCHAAAFRDQPGARRRHPQGRDPWLGMRCMSLVSCTARQESVESDDWQNGAFTEAILAALNSPRADSDEDGRLSFDEVQSFVRRETKRLARRVGVEQTPAIQLPSFVSDVFLAATR